MAVLNATVPGQQGLHGLKPDLTQRPSGYWSAPPAFPIGAVRSRTSCSFEKLLDTFAYAAVVRHVKLGSGSQRDRGIPQALSGQSAIALHFAGCAVGAVKGYPTAPGGPGTRSPRPSAHDRVAPQPLSRRAPPR